ncbi:phosphoribosylaminoimidazole carboxylase, ATPase subunit, partial [mine drainage metagenome]
MACADWTIVARYDDTEALLRLSESCQAITTEFENVPAASLEFLAARGVVRPSALSVAICQDRIREKTFLADNGFLTAPFIVVAGSSRPTPETIAPLLPGILKTSREGYDGKGQWPIDTIDVPFFRDR